MDAKTATRLLRAASRGEDASAARLLPAVYDQLRAIAAAYFRRQPPGHTLQPTALVHEAFLRLVHQPSADWKDRAHFLGIAARCMRQVLIAHARERGALKRGGGRARVAFDEGRLAMEDDSVDVLALDDALTELAVRDPRRARVVELRFFSGLTCAEAAAVLGISAKAAEASWYSARAWLRKRLKDS